MFKVIELHFYFRHHQTTPNDIPLYLNLNILGLILIFYNLSMTEFNKLPPIPTDG